MKLGFPKMNRKAVKGGDVRPLKVRPLTVDLGDGDALTVQCRALPETAAKGRRLRTQAAAARRAATDILRPGPPREAAIGWLLAFVCERVVSWDLEDDGKPVPVTPDGIRAAGVTVDDVLTVAFAVVREGA